MSSNSCMPSMPGRPKKTFDLKKSVPRIARLPIRVHCLVAKVTLYSFLTLFKSVQPLRLKTSISYISVIYGAIRDLFAAYCSGRQTGSNYDLKKGNRG